MTHFERIKSMDIEEMSEWLDQHGEFDTAPWTNWWDENYCKKCPSIRRKTEWGMNCEFGWCELHDRCKFFQHLNDIPDNKTVIKMWLESE